MKDKKLTTMRDSRNELLAALMEKESRLVDDGFKLKASSMFENFKSVIYQSSDLELQEYQKVRNNPKKLKDFERKVLNLRRRRIKFISKEIFPKSPIKLGQINNDVLREIIELRNAGTKSSEIIYEISKYFPKMNKGKLDKLIRGILQIIEVSEYYKKLGQVSAAGIRIFTRKDEDGIERDYWGFPSDMKCETRRKFITSSWENDAFAKINFDDKKIIDQRTRQCHKSLRQKDWEEIRKEFRKLRNSCKNNKGFPIGNIYEEILSKIKKGKLPNPRSIGNNKRKKNEEYPSIAYIKRKVYNRKNSSIQQ